MGVLPSLEGQIRRLSKNFGNSPGPELLLRGAQYTLETINFVMFISEEAEQAACAGCSMGVQTGSLYLAQRMADECMGQGSAKIWEFIVMYGIGFTPTWPAFYCFMYLTNRYTVSITRQLAAAWVAKGYYTRKDMESWPGTTTTIGEDLGLSDLDKDGLDQKRKSIKGWGDETGQALDNMIKLWLGEDTYNLYHSEQ